MSEKLSVYAQVAQELLNRIESGVYSSAQKLPSEYDLAKEFEVSRLTIRKAVDQLVNANQLMKYRGKGTYIVSQQKIQSGSFGLQGFTEAARSRGMEPLTKVIDFTEAYVPTVAIQQELALEADEQVYGIKRLRSADKSPLVIEEIYVPTRYLPKVTAGQLATASLFSLIEEVVDIGYSHQEIGAETVDEAQSLLLEVPVGAPILHVQSVTYSITSRPVLLDNSYYRADKYTFKNTLQRHH